MRENDDKVAQTLPGTGQRTENLEEVAIDADPECPDSTERGRQD